MKAIMVMFDSLNRHHLPPYGCTDVHAPNFARLAERSATFDNCYVGSMPCIPARRELHTGRYNFLHRSWGPLEPFDDSAPEILKQNGIYTHLVTDHQHYWEDGGGTYHPRYSSFEFFRGQEGDPWKGIVGDPCIPQALKPEHLVKTESIFPWLQNWKHDWINRAEIAKSGFPQKHTFDAGIDFLERNKEEDNWFLQIETFDPHEPFFAEEKFRSFYPDAYSGPHVDWPSYAPVKEPSETVEHIRKQYFSLLSMCDASLGRVLDKMDEYNLWEDTLLIVCTDHGYLLGEHGWWAKGLPPWYNELANTPFFIWDPRCRAQAVRRSALVQTVDIAPTLLDFFNIPLPNDMTGRALKDAIASDQSVRDVALFGAHGGHVNITDGRYVYMRAGDSNAPLYEYTLMPTHMRWRFSPEELQDINLVDSFSFTKGIRTLRIAARKPFFAEEQESLLFDLKTDPNQKNPLQNNEIERKFQEKLIAALNEHDAPQEQFERLKLARNI
ncbi:sulfatase [Gluconobacter cerinus]